MPKLWVGSGFARSSLFSERLICDCVALGAVFKAFFSLMVLLSESDINLNTSFFMHVSFSLVISFSIIYLFLLLFSPLRQDAPREAILVIFGRRALIFFFESSWKNEKWHHFCAHAQWWSPWRRKNVEKGHLGPSNLTFFFFIICDRHKRFSQNERRRVDLQKGASDFLIFAWGLSYDLSKFGDDFTPFFSTLKDHN